MLNQGNETHVNMQTGNVPQQMNHGGHEFFDVHEVLSGTIGVLNQYLLLRQHVKDPELMDILDCQYKFIQGAYNTTVESFMTGKDPSIPTQSYKMKQDNDFVYGLKPTAPKKPLQSVSGITDECISGLMLGSVKSMASLLAMSALEVTNPVVRRVLADSVPNWIELAYEISIYQNKHHYYQVPQLAQADIQNMLQAYGTVPVTIPNNGLKH